MAEQTSVEVGGIKFTGGKLFLVLTILSTLGGAAWGGFEFYNDYRNMKAKIESYQAPDLSGIDKSVALLEKRIDGDNIENINLMREKLRRNILARIQS